MLMLDAGIGVGHFGHTHDGLSTHYQVNNLSHYVFSLRLLPLLEKTAKTPGVAKGQVRIVAMSSELHRTIPSGVKFATKEEINTDVGPNGLYARSKLGEILLTRGLIKHKLSNISSQNPVYAIAVHPGAVGTRTMRSNLSVTFDCHFQLLNNRTCLKRRAHIPFLVKFSAR